MRARVHTPDTLAAIKVLWDDGVVAREIAERFGLTVNQILGLSRTNGWARRSQGFSGLNPLSRSAQIMREDMADAVALRREGRSDAYIADWLGWPIQQVRNRLKAEIARRVLQSASPNNLATPSLAATDHEGFRCAGPAT